MTARSALPFRCKLQDARVAEKTVGPTTARHSEAPFDLRMAFADVGDAKAASRFGLGRQELVYGEQRLLGTCTG